MITILVNGSPNVSSVFFQTFKALVQLDMTFCFHSCNMNAFIFTCLILTFSSFRFNYCKLKGHCEKLFCIQEGAEVDAEEDEDEMRKERKGG